MRSRLALSTLTISVTLVGSGAALGQACRPATPANEEGS